MHCHLFTSKVLLAGAVIALCACTRTTETLIDFSDKAQYPESSAVIEHKLWEPLQNGEAVVNAEGGILMPSAASGAWSAIKFNRPCYAKKEGDALTVSVDFTYEQTDAKYESEALRVGLSNGESELMATFNRKGWGDYHAIGREDYPVGYVFHTNKIGFKSNQSLGTSDPLRLSMTLTRAAGDTWDMVVLLENLDPESEFQKRWDHKGLGFETGDSDVLYGIIQNGEADADAGLANRIITRFEINSDQAPPAAPISWKGVKFNDYFLPMEAQSPLISEGSWGEASIMPRDTANGLEDTDLSHWCYWDCSIVKDDNGNYHMYASRWGQENAHSPGWRIHSKGVHAVSEDVMGPYKDLGIIWPQWNDGKGSNVIGLRMHDGRYAMVTSEITRGEVFVSDNPDGPWEFLGAIEVDHNGFSPGLARYNGGKGNMSNVMIILRHDGRYMIVPRSTAIMISEDGILGPYKIMSDRVYEDMPEIPQSRMEDPTCWYSGGMYHMLVNHWPGKTTYHFSSEDGIHDWKYRGIAYRKDESIFRYTDGTVDEWPIVQRPTAYTEDGHITHFNFSVLDVSKGEDKGGDRHGSKIIVVPFDGEAFDREMRKIVAEE